MTHEEQSDDDDGYSELITSNPPKEETPNVIPATSFSEKPKAQKTSAKAKEANSISKAKNSAASQSSAPIKHSQQPSAVPSAQPVPIPSAQPASVPYATQPAAMSYTTQPTMPYAAQPAMPYATQPAMPYATQPGFTQYTPAEGYSTELPLVPDLEEQEYLSQLLLAWYQAGYAAGRYMQFRQQKKCIVC